MAHYITRPLEQFSFECRKVIGFAVPRYTIGLENSRHFVIQSEVKLRHLFPRFAFAYYFEF